MKPANEQPEKTKTAKNTEEYIFKIFHVYVEFIEPTLIYIMIFGLFLFPTAVYAM